MLLKAYFRHRNCFLSPFAKDGNDGNGIEKNALFNSEQKTKGAHDCLNDQKFPSNIVLDGAAEQHTLSRKMLDEKVLI